MYDSVGQTYQNCVLTQNNISVFQDSRPYVGLCPDPKHFIVNCEQNVVNFAENVLKNAISI